MSNVLVCVGLWFLAIIATTGIAAIALGIWVYFVFFGTEVRANAALEKLRSTLMPNESLLVECVQLRPFALWHRRQALGVSSSRIIVVSRGLLGGFTMSDIQWKDLQDAEINENVLPDLCGSSLSFGFHKRDLGSSNRSVSGSTARNGLPSLIVPGMPSEEARAIYSNAQAHEQAWEEKRRVRAIEETRAAAGGVFVSTGPGGPNESSPAGGSVVEELKKLKGLLDAGVVSDAEFQEMKAKIIARA